MQRASSIKKIHFIGIGGISMSAIAKLLLMWGSEVSGSDAVYSKNVEELIEWGADVYVGENEEKIDKADLIVYNGAIKRDNPEFKLALEKGKKLISREYLLYEISQEFYETVAISGTHGKTTVTAMLASVIEESGKSFTAHVGGQSEKGNLIYKGKDIFLTEACEYNRSFLALRPKVGVILNIECDHPDTYKNMDELTKAFLSFASQIQREGTLILNADDSNYHILKSTYKHTFTYAIENTADLIATNIINYGGGQYGFRILQNGYPYCDIKLKIAGYHNVYNALATFSCGLALGIKREDIVRGIEKFSGVKGRFEYLGSRKGACFFRDYAHHPTEIRASIKTAVEKAGTGRVVVVFQPHTLLRTEVLFDDFKKELLGADKLYLLKEYVARVEQGGKTAYDLYQEISKTKGDVRYYDRQLELASDLMLDLKRGDLVLILGAGSVSEMGALLLK